MLTTIHGETMTSESLPVARLLTGGSVIASGVPEGLDAAVLGMLARLLGSGKRHKPILHIARDGQRLAILDDALQFFAPEVKLLSFPAWDGVPYDRVAPNPEIVAPRVATLAELAAGSADETPLIVLTTVNAVLQRVPSREFFATAIQRFVPGDAVSMAELIEKLEHVGYGRAGTVTDPGQYAVRGGIIDFYPPRARPVRLDFFGDTLESMRAFDPETQRTFSRLDEVTLLPMSEAPLTEEARGRFRARYVELFGPVRGDDPLYESISAGRQHQGMEHWLPLFHERLETLFDYLPDAVVTCDALDDNARAKRLEQVKDHYEARQQALERKAFGAPPYNPVPPESLFLTEANWQKALQGGQKIVLDPFEHPEATRDATIVSFGGKQGRSFAAERQREGGNVFDAVVAHTARLQGEGKRVLIACWSKGAKERLAALLAEHGIGDTLRVDTWQKVLAAPPMATTFAVLPLEAGFEAPRMSCSPMTAKPGASKPVSSGSTANVVAIGGAASTFCQVSTRRVSPMPCSASNAPSRSLAPLLQQATSTRFPSPCSLAACATTASKTFPPSRSAAKERPCLPPKDTMVASRVASGCSKGSRTIF